MLGEDGRDDTPLNFIGCWAMAETHMGNKVKGVCAVPGSRAQLLDAARNIPIMRASLRKGVF